MHLRTDIYIYIYIHTNIAESRIEHDYWPRFARYAHAAGQLVILANTNSSNNNHSNSNNNPKLMYLL